jgi:hypothetical protein
MPTLINEQETTWVDHLAGRLRLIQADAAEATAEKRREYLQEEVSRALKDVPHSSRKRLLGAALSRFPVGGQVATTAAVAPAPVAKPPPPDTPDQLLEKLLAAAPQLGAEKRAEFIARLAEAGFVSTDTSGAQVQVSDTLRQKLGLPAGKDAQLAQVVELAAYLTEMFARLDQACLKTTRELSPKSRLLQRQQDFRTAAAAYLVGDLETVEPHMRQASTLTGTLLAALLGGGRDFGRQFVETLAPNAIENVVDSEGVSILKNKYQMYWDRYKLLSRDFATADLVDRRVRDSVSAFIDRAGAGS